MALAKEKSLSNKQTNKHMQTTMRTFNGKLTAENLEVRHAYGVQVLRIGGRDGTHREERCEARRQGHRRLRIACKSMMGEVHESIVEYACPPPLQYVHTASTVSSLGCDGTHREERCKARRQGHRRLRIACKSMMGEAHENVLLEYSCRIQREKHANPFLPSLQYVLVVRLRRFLQKQST